MSSGQRVIFVHIGPPKTGTSFVQSVLWAAKPELRKQGLTLPMRSVRDHLRVANDVCERGRPAKQAGGLDAFAAALRRVNTPRALFSMEVIVGAAPEQIDRFYAALAGFDIHVIITARDLARQIPATWQQSLRHRISDQPYGEYLRDVLDDPELTHPVWRRQDIAEVARRWGRSLSPDRIHIVTVPPAEAPSHLLLERFCRVIGVDPGRLKTDLVRTNPSLKAPQAELLRRVNNALGDRLPAGAAGATPLVNGYFAMTVLAAQSGPPLRLPVRYAARTRGLYERMVKEISERGYHVVGDLTDLEPAAFSGGDAADRRGPDASDAEIAEAGVQALAAVLEQRHQDLELIRKLRKRPGPAKAAVRAGDESWVQRQRRRVAIVRRDPSALADRLRRLRS